MFSYNQLPLLKDKILEKVVFYANKMGYSTDFSKIAEQIKADQAKANEGLKPLQKLVKSKWQLEMEKATPLTYRKRLTINI